MKNTAMKQDSFFSTVLITGGAGFIGCNAAAAFLQRGSRVIIVDNFSREGSRENLSWLQTLPNQENLEVIELDIRQPSPELTKVVAKATLILHLAAQVAVTTSVENPQLDFAINAGGTLVMLEAARRSKKKPIFLYSSTNKVYGDLIDLPVVEEKTRYRFASGAGISETQPLDFHSPYGCSKGAADQYVRDYYRIYGLRTVVFRQSCIYGPHQFGIEDQGWLAWFMIAALQHKPVTLFGTGKQVRDVLWIDDLVAAYTLAVEAIEKTQGQIYNIGGGPENTLSVWWEFGAKLGDLIGVAVQPTWSKERPGDQKLFVSDISKAKRDFAWSPRVKVSEGVKKLALWLKENIS